jgi:hypothetical protein
MFKPLLSIFAVSVLGLLLTGARTAPQTEAAQGIPGYYNPATHTFQAKVVRQVEADVTTKPYAGKFVFEYTIKLETPVPSGQDLYCGATASLEDPDTDNVYQENASTIAKVSGTSATCTVNIPYAWTLASDDYVGLSFQLIIAPPAASTGFTELPTRNHTSDLPPMVVPANGVTTYLKVSETI